VVLKLASQTQRAEAIGILKSQVETERQLIELYSDTQELVVDDQVRRLLHSLQLDSTKHVEMCVTAIEVLEGEKPFGEDRVELEVGLDHHMELEEESFKRAELLLGNPAVSENEGLRRIIEAWKADEVAHHGLLRDLTRGRFTRRRLMDTYSSYRAEAMRKLGDELRDLIKRK